MPRFDSGKVSPLCAIPAVQMQVQMRRFEFFASHLATAGYIFSYIVVAFWLLLASNAASCAVEMGSMRMRTTQCARLQPCTSTKTINKTNNTEFPTNEVSLLFFLRFWNKWWCDNDNALQLPTNIYDLVSQYRQKRHRTDSNESSVSLDGSNEANRCLRIQIQLIDLLWDANVYRIR